MQVDVSGSGAIAIGDLVTCDGFIYGFPIRVQTHVHIDHMDGFGSSKGYQHILVTNPTRDLLIAEFDADIPYRTNIEAIPTGQPVSREDCEILLLDNGHMLGAAQVCVTLPNGLRCGYSSDFAWPLDNVIEVDELVLDCTYGSPDSIRKFTQEEVVGLFTELIIERAKMGPVHITGHRGVLQRALLCLDGVVREPIIVSPRLRKELEVYRRYGYGLPEVSQADATVAQEALNEGRYIRVYGTGDRLPTDPSGGTSVTLKAHLSGMERPVVSYSDNAFAVAFSDHADYEGTLEYVRETGAKLVLTDSIRSGTYATKLALALQRELGIEAKPSKTRPTREWGV